MISNGPLTLKPSQSSGCNAGNTFLRACYSCFCCALVVFLVVLVVCASKTRHSDVTPEFIQKRLDGDPIFGWYSMPVRQPEALMEQVRSQLVDGPLIPPSSSEGKSSNLTLASAPAVDAARLMYKATKIPGVWEKVPEELRGVFWMRGNGAPEELVVLQYGQWFEEDQMYIVPMAPFMWGWPRGRPAEAPFGGAMYDVNLTVEVALAIVSNGLPGVALSFAFGPCPRNMACDAGSSDLTYASLQNHPEGDLRETNQFPAGHFTLELMSGGAARGDLWYRRCTWGVGNCACIDFGSYQLIKIIDGDGSAIEPSHSDFIAYMGDVSIFMWSGFVDGAGTPPGS